MERASVASVRAQSGVRARARACVRACVSVRACMRESVHVRASVRACERPCVRACKVYGWEGRLPSHRSTWGSRSFVTKASE